MRGTWQGGGPWGSQHSQTRAMQKFHPQSPETREQGGNGAVLTRKDHTRGETDVDTRGGLKQGKRGL